MPDGGFILLAYEPGFNVWLRISDDEPFATRKEAERYKAQVKRLHREGTAFLAYTKFRIAPAGG